MNPRSTPSCRAFGVYQVDFQAIAWHIQLVDLPMTHDGDFPVMIRYDSLMEGRWCRWKPAKPRTFELFLSRTNSTLVHSPWKRNRRWPKSVCILTDPIIRSSHLATNCYSRYPAPIWSEILGSTHRFFFQRPESSCLYDSSIIQWELFPTIQDPTRKIVIEPWTSSSNRDKIHEESVKITINFPIYWTIPFESIKHPISPSFFMAITWP